MNRYAMGGSALTRPVRYRSETGLETVTVGVDSLEADGTEQDVEWNQLPQLPLGFPRGEAGFLGNRHFGTDWQKSLMRGGDS